MSLKSLVPFDWFEIPRSSSPSPSLRVGHSATFVRSSAKIYLLGGANPSECFSDFYSLSLPSRFAENFFWTKLIGENPSLQRYEHSTVLSTINGEKLIFFGGANTETNFNDVQALDLSTQSIENWTSKDNEIVSARTHHASCSIGDALFVFSGGLQGVKAVDDSELYRFDLSTRRWSIVSTCGVPPEPRHGHCLFSLENRFLFVHGGMDGRSFFSSIYSIDLQEKSPRWKEHSSSSSSSSSTPVARAAHAGVAVEKSLTLFIFAGFTRQGQALNDLWSWTKSTEQWTEIVCRSMIPRPRLDFAYCLVDEQIDEERTRSFLFVHGGTDTQGEVFDDAFLLRLTFDQDE